MGDGESFVGLRAGLQESNNSVVVALAVADEDVVGEWDDVDVAMNEQFTRESGLIGARSDEGKEEVSFLAYQIERHLKCFIDRRLEYLLNLRRVIEGDPVIPSTLTDAQLILFLFTMNYDIPQTMSLLKSNYELRISLPRSYSARSVFDTRIQDVWDILKIGVFPKKLSNHRHIIFLGLRDRTPENFSAPAILKLVLMCADVYHIIMGLPYRLVLVVDAGGASTGFISRENYIHLKIFTKYVQESMPYNIEEVHVVNTSPVARRLFRLVKPFLTKDIINKIKFYNSDDLTEFLPQRCLPVEHGGTAPGTIDEYEVRFRQRFELVQEFFDLEEEQRTTHHYSTMGLLVIPP